MVKDKGKNKNKKVYDSVAVSCQTSVDNDPLGGGHRGVDAADAQGTIYSFAYGGFHNPASRFTQDFKDKSREYLKRLDLFLLTDDSYNTKKSQGNTKVVYDDDCRREVRKQFYDILCNCIGESNDRKYASNDRFAEVFSKFIVRLISKYESESSSNKRIRKEDWKKIPHAFEGMIRDLMDELDKFYAYKKPMKVTRQASYGPSLEQSTAYVHRERAGIYISNAESRRNENRTEDVSSFEYRSPLKLKTDDGKVLGLFKRTKRVKMYSQGDPLITGCSEIVKWHLYNSVMDLLNEKGFLSLSRVNMPWQAPKIPDYRDGAGCVNGLSNCIVSRNESEFLHYKRNFALVLVSIGLACYPLLKLGQFTFSIFNDGENTEEYKESLQSTLSIALGASSALFILLAAVRSIVESSDRKSTKKYYDALGIMAKANIAGNDLSTEDASLIAAEEGVSLPPSYSFADASTSIAFSGRQEEGQLSAV